MTKPYESKSFEGLIKSLINDYNGSKSLDDKLEIIDISNRIGTYKTSILPYEDCCTIFVPKHPIINPSINKCLEIEKRIDYETLIDEAIKNIETITNLEKEKNDLL